MTAWIIREILSNLATAGFRLNMGPDGGGALPAFLSRGGGTYIGEHADFMSSLLCLTISAQTQAPVGLLPTERSS